MSYSILEKGHLYPQAGFVQFWISMQSLRVHSTKWLALEMITCCKTAFWNYYLLIFQTASGRPVWRLARHQKTHLRQVMGLFWFVWLQMRWTFCKSSLLSCWTTVRPHWPQTTADVQSCRWDSTRRWLSLFSSSSLMGMTFYTVTNGRTVVF